MLTGLLMILLPVAVYLFTLPVSGRLRPGLLITYRILGGVVVVLGGGFSFYLAWYTGEQGGIAAYFFQLCVIAAYLTISIAIVVVNWILSARYRKKE